MHAETQSEAGFQVAQAGLELGIFLPQSLGSCNHWRGPPCPAQSWLLTSVLTFVINSQLVFISHVVNVCKVLNQGAREKTLWLSSYYFSEDKGSVPIPCVVAHTHL